jgi:hypothetical protein
VTAIASIAARAAEKLSLAKSLESKDDAASVRWRDILLIEANALSEMAAELRAAPHVASHPQARRRG